MHVWPDWSSCLHLFFLLGYPPSPRPLALGSSLQGRYVTGQNAGGPQAFLAFVLHISELLELRVFTEEVKENDG